MNAHALLTAQGWRGHGHSLHKSDDSIGLAKPLLLNRKSNTKGLGVAQHFNNDQWWLSAFDEQLKGLEMTENGVKQTVTTGKLNTIQKGPLGRWSVYSSFVKGGFLEGTLSLLEKSSTDSSSTGDESSDEGVTSKNDDGNIATIEAKEDKKEAKEERRARREAKRKRKEERAKEKEARRERKKAKAKGIDVPSKSESKEEKRLRREKKKEKRRKREEESKKKKKS